MAEKRNEITDIEVQKKDKNRVSIFLDDRYAFGLDIMTAATLSRGERLTRERIEELKEKDALSRAWKYSLRFLGARARSIKEMRIYLKGKEFSGVIIDKVVEKLLDAGYLNDGEFAGLWVDSRRRFNPRGCWLLRQELKQKGVCESDIENALDDYDEGEAAWSAVVRKLPVWKALDSEKLKKKVFAFLSSRGFSWDTTEDAYRKTLCELEDLKKDGAPI